MLGGDCGGGWVVWMGSEAGCEMWQYGVCWWDAMCWFAQLMDRCVRDLLRAVLRV